MWNNCKRILCIRADNMGDIIMSGPAMRALKETFGAHITVLTSTMAQAIVPYMPMIDEVIVANLPWVKAANPFNEAGIQELIGQLRKQAFDAAVIFTVYSQSALPAAMLTYLAGIPRRLAYSRENPYELLTHWVPDEEPYRYIVHQVERDLKLVNNVGACTANDQLEVHIDPAARRSVRDKLRTAGFRYPDRFIVMHPGVSEARRQFPQGHWQTITALLHRKGIPMVFTGAGSERSLAQSIITCTAADQQCVCNAAGLLSLGEFLALVDESTMVLSVNTATIHIAAARQKVVIALYALTNPQHTPWKTPGKVLPYTIKEESKSRNEIVTYVQDHLLDPHPLPPPEQVAGLLEGWWNKIMGGVAAT